MGGCACCRSCFGHGLDECKDISACGYRLRQERHPNSQRTNCTRRRQRFGFTLRAPSLAGKLYPGSDERVQELLCLKTDQTKTIDEDGYQ